MFKHEKFPGCQLSRPEIDSLCEEILSVAPGMDDLEDFIKVLRDDAAREYLITYIQQERL